jgi:ubiquinone/menaquinone biosynthesis C-methylase UbiE
LNTPKWHFYDESERRKWQNPEEILQAGGLKSGHTLIDIGCGQGFFTLPAARIVGDQGRIYGIDSSSESIALLQQKADSAGLKNISLVVGNGETSLVCEGCADLVFLGIVLHDFYDPQLVLDNARKMLKPEGRLVNLDWKKEAMNLGPPLEKRFDIATASALMRRAGFILEDSREYGPYNYLMTAYVRR